MVETTFELSNHLDNVIATISDKKIGVSSNGTAVDYYMPDIFSATNYSTYGAMVNSFNGNDIDKAFNGQKRSQEISPAAQTALYWGYNGDVGRRWNRDPFAKVKW